jgi:hypothetical protein
MVKTDFSGTFLNTETCNNEDVGVVLSEGKIISKTSATGKPYTALEIDVEVNSKKLTYVVFDPVGKVLQKAWGLDSADWVGKQFRCEHVHYTSYGNKKVRVDISPLVEKK